jgi:TRAP-type C4-dicarboxylate transport system permease small subunit
MAVCLVLTYAATTFVINEASFDSGRMLLGLTSWQLNLIFPISFGLISLHFLIEMLSGIWQSLRPTSPC